MTTHASERGVVGQASKVAGTALAILMSAGCVQSRAQTLQPPAQFDQQASAIELEVVDPQGAVIANARVQLKDDSGQVRASGITNQAGALELIPPAGGSYSIEVSAPGFESHTEKLTVKSPSITRVEMKLAVGQGAGSDWGPYQPAMAVAEPPPPTEIGLLPITPVPAPTQPANPFKRFFKKLFHK